MPAADQHRAHLAVAAAVMVGVLPPVDTVPCVGCGVEAQHYHHPHGYDQANWLDVEALCRRCHRRRHPREAPPRGRSPHKPGLIRFPPEVYEGIEENAREERRSITGMVVRLVEEALEWRRRQRAGAPPFRVAEGEGPPYRPHGEEQGREQG